MTQHLKIKVVIGLLRDPAVLQFWEELSTHHSIELYALDSSDRSLATTLPVVMFPQIPEMPGFFRDLDKHLHGADLVIGIETSKLYSFQALRAARKLGIHFACVVHEYSPLVYERYSNIRAIQHDIHQNSDVFFPTSRRAAQLLQLEGVPIERITKIPMAADTAKFTFDERGRVRFKKYVGVPDDCTLITLKTSINDLEPALTAIQGVRLGLNQLSPEKRSKVRLLVCGEGEGTTKLKYEVADLGLGSRAMFLAQDTAPFIADLLCATDVLIEGRWGNKKDPEPLPWHVLGSACSGVSIILSGGTIADDWLSGVDARRLDDYSAMDVAMALSSVLNREADPEFTRRRISANAATQLLSPAHPAEIMNAAITKMCSSDEKTARRDGLSKFIHQHQIPISYKDASDVLFKCEELREFASTCETEKYSEILRIRGDALVALARGDEAIVAFEQSLKTNQSNYQALRGLGYLAWHGHSHEDALSFFKRGLAVNPNDYQCLVGVGLVYRRLKMFSESVYWLQKAVAVGGPDSPSLSLVVQACLENPGLPESLEALHSLRDSVGDHPNLVMAIGKLESHQ